MDPVPASQDMQPSVWKTSLGVIQKVGSLRRWGGGLWKASKSEQGEGVLACVYVRFLKKNAEIFKMKFDIIQFFLLIIMAVWNITNHHERS